MNIWKITLILTLLLSSITSQAQKEKISLNSEGNLAVWRVKAQAEVTDPSLIMSVRYNTEGWVKATVPGTVFGSYVSEGLEPDPNFGDNAYTIDKSKYDRNFWYRTEFLSPKVETGEKVWLNFEGVNRKYKRQFLYIGLERRFPTMQALLTFRVQAGTGCLMYRDF